MPPALDGRRAADRCYGCNFGVYFLPHLPSLYAATLLKKNGFTVAILDFPAKNKAPKEFEEFAKTDDSDAYFFYSVFLSEATDLKAREILRKCNKKARYIYAGTQATWAPENFADNDSIVVRGEPEITALELAKALKPGGNLGKVLGITYKDGKGIHHNKTRPPLENLDELPIPDRTLLDHSPYYNPKMSKTPHAAILTSRGCFGRCWYCVPNSLSFAREIEYKKTMHCKPAPRLHSAKRVVEEFKQIAKLGFKSVSIIDDEFLWTDQRTLEICNGIENLGLEWSCLARVDKITQTGVRAMKKAGCTYIDLGVESFDQKVLDAIGKDVNVGQIRTAIQTIKSAGIHPEINVLLGATPQETEQTIRHTIDEVEKLDVDFVLYNIAAPFPGTEFYSEAKKQKWMTTEDYVPIDPSKETITNYPHLPKERLEQLLSEAYTRHYFNPKYVAKQLLAVKSPQDFARKAQTALNIFKRNVLRSY